MISLNFLYYNTNSAHDATRNKREIRLTRLLTLGGTLLLAMHRYTPESNLSKISVNIYHWATTIHSLVQIRSLRVCPNPKSSWSAKTRRYTFYAKFFLKAQDKLYGLNSYESPLRFVQYKWSPSIRFLTCSGCSAPARSLPTLQLNKQIPDDYGIINGVSNLHESFFLASIFSFLLVSSSLYVFI